MNAGLTPMRWPSSWKEPSALSLLKGTSINYLLAEKTAGLEPIVDQARANGIQASEIPPAGVTVVPGEWPGIKLSSSGTSASASAGPTGAPWVDSNGWVARLAAELHPDSAIWIEAAPKGPRLFPQSYRLALADTAARGGRWVLSLDNDLAAAIVAGNAGARDTWGAITRAADFFASHTAWSDYLPEAVIGVISDFSDENEFFSHELLNLLDRTSQQYRIIVKAKASAEAMKDLRAVIYPDLAPPAPELRRQILAFIDAGGMLITGPKWGPMPGSPAKSDGHPRYASRVLGKGKLAVAKLELDDPYLLANDSVILVSHRYDLLRFWNGGALGSYFTVARDRKRAAVHMLFYAERGQNAVSVRVAGRYRTAKLWTVDQSSARSVEMVPQDGAVELHLPAVSEYAAVELEL